MDVLFEQASVTEQEPVGAPQVEQPPAGPVGPDHLAGFPPETIPRRLGHPWSHLIVLWGDCGPDSGHDVRRPAAKTAHGLDRGFGHAGYGPPPSGVHAGQDAGDWIAEHDRNAVRDHHDEDDAGLGRDQRVRSGNGGVQAVRTAPAVRPSHDPDLTAMSLLAENQVVQVRMQGGRRPAPVLEHTVAVVTDVETEVQRLVRPARDTAFPGRHQGVDLQPGKGRPAQDFQAAGAAQSHFVRN